MQTTRVAAGLGGLFAVSTILLVTQLVSSVTLVLGA
jgi:hypothetical protein